MESSVSNLDSKPDDFKTSQAKFWDEVIAGQAVILQQLQLLAEKLGVESSAPTPTHQPFIKSKSPLSLEKSDEIVLKLQSFHKEKVRAREKRDEFWSQFRPRYKPKTRPCLRPILKKFKKVRDYGKHRDDESATSSSNPKFQESFGVFRKTLARENKNGFNLFDKVAKESVGIPPFLDSDCMKSKIQACALGSSFSNGLGAAFSDQFKQFSTSPSSNRESNCKNDLVQDFTFIISASDNGFVKADPLALQVFDERPHSADCDFQLGYHMPISDTGSTLRRFFTSNVQIKDAHSSKFLVCTGEVVNNGIIVQLKLGFHELILDKGGTTIQRLFHSKSATVLESDCYILHIQLGYHTSIRDKGGTKFLSSFESMDLLASCEDSSLCVVINRSMGLFNSKSKNTDYVICFDCSKVVKCEESIDYSMIIDGVYAGNLGLHHLEACIDKNRKDESKFTLFRFKTGCCVVCCVVLDRDYCMGIRDKGGGSKFRAGKNKSPNVREEYLVLSFHRQMKLPFGSSVHGSFGLPDTSHILEDGILTGQRMTITRYHSCEYDEHRKVEAAFTGAKHMPKQMNYNSNSKFSIISEYKDVVNGAWISHDIDDSTGAMMPKSSSRDRDSLDLPKKLKRNTGNGRNGKWSSASKLVNGKHLHFAGSLVGSVLCIGISISIISSFIANKREVDELKDWLKQTKNLVRDLAMQVVACPQVQYVSIKDIPESIVHTKKELERQREDLLSKPENTRERIMEGRISKRLGELALLEQPFIKDDSLLVKNLVK